MTGLFSFHNTLKFHNSWSIEEVNTIFSHLNINSADYIVFDPFMGAGTTLIAACLQGFDCIGNDISPISYFSTYTKLIPPSVKDFEKLEKRITQFNLPEKIVEVKKKSNKKIDIYYNFIIGLTLYNKKCDNYSAFYNINVNDYIKTLDDLKKIKTNYSFKNNTKLYCIDFFKFPKKNQPKKVVLLTSPPFFNSSESEVKQFIDSFLRVNFHTTNLYIHKNRKESDLMLVSNGKIFSDSVSQVVLNYLSFVDMVLSSIELRDFPIIAFEVATIYPLYGELGFDKYWVCNLEKLGYKIHILYDVVIDYKGINVIIARKL